MSGAIDSDEDSEAVTDAKGESDAESESDTDLEVATNAHQNKLRGKFMDRNETSNYPSGI
ncbi:MAG: hypothetical protein AB2693_17215 [Candidatus Thiodiazotropha sp.]